MPQCQKNNSHIHSSLVSALTNIDPLQKIELQGCNCLDKRYLPSLWHTIQAFNL